MESFIVQVEHVLSIMATLIFVVITPILWVNNKINKNEASAKENRTSIETLKELNNARIESLERTYARHEEKCSQKYDQLYSLCRNMQGDISEIKGEIKHAKCLED